ncbi:methyltransferase domain-containing protein [Mesorhizobium sp. RMAD-H1]|uniref:class I SAM-dependent methyltransferase n=1 Tax=Mesorhizobium sp. RMAD-H1 TaxID=2587065 RepID=UPI001613335C|nr:methyltransferase domain-containing protein [Mesorhizobium sp. RMAD-H1]MBB2971863.1 ubiquinone/menaquinone biosynthesis C-methylase UbiE [Mesorhizobium sp. RMAD-H1]
MSEKSHETLVGGQFGSRAEAYLKSAVHAQSPDLDAMVGVMREHKDARVLDLGCGGGHVTFNVSPLVKEVVAYDLSPEMLNVVARAARERGLDNVSTRQGTVESLPFDADSFDVVLSRFSAHHWRDLDAALREAARVLKPGGMLAIVDTVTPGIPLVDTYLQAIELLRDCSHVRNYSRAEWEAAIARAGLQPRSVSAFRLRLDFSAWVERMNTPQLHVDAIRSLQTAVSVQATRHFDTEPDGSYCIDVGLFQATKRA